MNLQEATIYATKNPNTDFAKKLVSRYESGELDNEAKKFNIDTSVFKKEKSYSDRTFSGVKEKISEAKKQVGFGDQSSYEGQSALRRGTGSVASIASVPFVPVAEAIKEIPGVKQVGEFASGLFNKAVDTISSSKRLQESTQGDTSRLEDVLGTVSNVGNIADTILGAKGTQKSITSVIDEGKNLARSAGRGSLKVAEDISRVLPDRSRFTAPSLKQEELVSLNPIKALNNTGQDFQVSVGGKLKQISSLDELDKAKLKLSTEKSVSKFTEQAEKFKNDRSVSGGSPLEIVGRRADSAVTFLDKKRQLVGSKMGEIESKFHKSDYPLSEKVIQPFLDIEKSVESKYSLLKGSEEIYKNIQSNLENLYNSKGNIGERLDFIRSTERYLQDMKDGFGNFKENNFFNTKLQSAISELKKDTIGFIEKSDNSGNYSKLRKNYSKYKKLDDEANRLLGKYGLQGDRNKGAALAKRAIQSNSDAGARQFLKELKDLTGYDAIRDADLATIAMESVGDYQGLSLLDIARKGKTGILEKGLEKIQDTLIGDQKTRIKKYIQN